ncbi:GDP-mannose 4,6-dehydratase, partial [Singulisphaera rosea]
PVTIRGDGRQVRDLLWVDDLIDAYELAARKMDRVSGEAFNVGGGPENALSLMDAIGAIESSLRMPLETRFAAWRPGDQRVYISDNRKALSALVWRPKVSAADGIDRLMRWILANQTELRSAHHPDQGRPS